MITYIFSLFPKQFIWIFSKKYIAGESMDDAINKVADLGSNKIMATVDLLGEMVEEREHALKYQEKYLKIISTSAGQKQDCSFSLKPTMFGLLWDFEFCYESIRKIVEHAASYNYMVRIDMEDSECTDDELELFELLYEEFPANVGIVLQACLKRSLTDVIWLKTRSNDDHPVNIRLCKGIYIEHTKIAFKRKADIRENFLACLDKIFEYELFPAIATLDEFLIEESKKMIEDLAISKDSYEFQMLLGVVPKLQLRLISENHPVRVYVPYGKDWFRYSFRRLQENPKMLRHIIGSMFTNK